MNKGEIGRYVVERRDTLNVSQARLAELSGVSVHTISNLETGNGNVTLDTLLKVAGILGLKVEIGV
jgi:transcriptional regulator with XRE-family HTH domain